MILDYQQTIAQIIAWKQQGKKIAFATGVFDILHQEHLKFLQKAAQEGDKLVVGLEPDHRVRDLKGAGRPIHPLARRLQQLEDQQVADICFTLPVVSNWLTFMQTLQPDIYCVSSHSPYLVAKRRICQQAGIRCKVVHRHNPNVSTTKMIVVNNQL